MSGDSGTSKNRGLQSGFLRAYFLGTSSRFVPNMFYSLAISGILLGSCPSAAYAVSAKALPQGGKVIGGKASFKSSAGKLTVTQTTNRAVIDWKSFDIGEKAVTEFKQLNASSIAVNRVIGNKNPTQILGSLKSNGRLIILDQNGVMFGKNSKVDVGGLIASTGSINVRQFMAGSNKLSLTGIKKGKIENNGRITAKDGGLVAFVAPEVINNGVIQANLGRIDLVSGPAATLDFYGDQLVSVAVTGELKKSLISNKGTLRADGGTVSMTARAAKNAVDDVINTSGIVQAQSFSNKGGKIILSAGNNGVTVSGTMDVSSATGKGGYVEVTGKDVDLRNARVEASGRTGGGEVLIGGDLNGTLARGVKRANNTFVSADSVINTDALQTGNGGIVVVWGDNNTQFFGNINARGGSASGNGGFVEVSTGDGVIFDGIVNTTAAMGNVGTLLIDPAVVSIGNGPDTFDGTYLNAGNLADTLVFTSMTILADNEINIVEDINLSNGPNFGATEYGLTLETSTINLLNDIIMGQGGVHLNAPTLNIDAKITDSMGQLLGVTKLTGTAATVNVLGNNASVQQAIYAASNVSPATVNLAAADYSENITINKSLDLMGQAGVRMMGAANAGTVINVAANNVRIEGISFDGAASNSATAISGSAAGTTVTGNSFTGFDVAGVNFTSANNLSVMSNSFTAMGLDAVRVVGGDNISIGDNVISADGAGVFGAARYGVYVADATNADVSNNTVRGENGATGAGDSAIYLDNADGIFVDGNRIEGLTGGTGAVAYGIYMEDSDSATVTNNTIYSDSSETSVGAATPFSLTLNNTNLTENNNQTISDYVPPPPPPDDDPPPPPPPDDDPPPPPPDDDPPPPPPDDDPPPPPPGDTDPRVLKLEKFIDKLETGIEYLEAKIEDTSSRLLIALYKLEIHKLEKLIEKTEKLIDKIEDGDVPPRNGHGWSGKKHDFWKKIGHHFSKGKHRH